MADILTIENLSVRYPDGREALKGVSLAVPAGRRVGLIGPNGAGKTTLLLAVLRGVPFDGRIVIDGLESVRRNTRAIRSRCGMVFQETDDQLFMPTLLDDVAFGPLNQGLDASAAEAQARTAVADVGLAGLERTCAHHLSAGEKRCAALATILAMNVKLLLLDEPGANLDVRSRRRIINILTQRPEAMLLATHDLDMVATLCGSVVVLDGGEVVAAGPADELLGDRQLLAAHGLA